MRASRRLLFFLAALSSTFVLLLTVRPASAHTGFESSDPVDGSTVTAPIDEITITFSGAAVPTGEGFVVLDPSGTVRTPDAVGSDSGQQVWTLGFVPPLTDGAVGIRWTVQAPDAHPIMGGFSFTVAGSDVPNPDDPDSAGDASPATATAPAATRSSDDSGDDSTGEIVSESVTAAGSDATGMSSEEAQDLHAFLQRSDQAVPYAASAGAFGRLLGFVGTMLGIGGLAFAHVVVRNHRRDLRSVLKAVRYAAAVVVIGTVVDLIAHVAVAGNGWTTVTAGSVGSATLSTFGLAIALRLAAGSLLFASARVVDHHRARIESVDPRRELALVGGSNHAVVGGSTSVFETHGWIEDTTSWSDSDDPPLSNPTLVAVALLVASFTFDGHTATEGNWWVTAAVDMVHVVAGSIWAGGVAAFAVVLWRRSRRREPLGGLELALRFSTVAGAALAIAGLAGTILAVIILDSVSDLWATPWGRLLMAKTVAVAAAAALGTYNHLVVIPWMNAHPDDDARSVRIRNTVTGEAVLLTAVIVLTAFLVGAASQV